MNKEKRLKECYDRARRAYDESDGAYSLMLAVQIIAEHEQRIEKLENALMNAATHEHVEKPFSPGPRDLTGQHHCDSCGQVTYHNLTISEDESKAHQCSRCGTVSYEE